MIKLLSMDAAKPPLNKFVHVFTISLCLLPIIGILIPRFMAFAPAIIGLVGFITYRISTGTFPNLCRPAALISAVIITLTLLSSLWAIDPDFAIKRTVKTLPIMLGGTLLLSTLLTLNRAKTLNTVAPLFARYWIYALIIAGTVLTIDLYTDGLIYRIIRPDFNKNFVGAGLNRSVIIFTLCTLAGLAVLKKQKNPRPDCTIITRKAFVLCALLLAVLIGTENQSAQLATILAVLIYFVFPLSQRWTWMVLGLGLAGAAMFAPFLAQYLFKTIAPLVHDMPWLKDGYAANRLEIWNFVSEYALQSPLYGYGVEACRSITDFNVRFIFHDTQIILHPHNFAIQVWLEFGVLGGALLAGLLYFFVHKLRALPPTIAKLIVPQVLALISIAAMTYGIWQGWWIGTIFTIITIYIALAGTQKS